MIDDGHPITSLANPRIREAVRLRDRRHRDATGLTIVDGAREIGRALDAGIEIVEAYVCDPRVESDDARDVRTRLSAARGPRLTPVSRAVLDKLAFGDRSDGIVAVVRPRVQRLADIELPPRPLVAVVEGVEKPGNLGAILRSADGAGIDAVIAADPATDLVNPNTIRASIGTIFARPVVAATALETLAWLRDRGLRIVAARVDGTADPWDTDLRGAVAVILGSESAGLTPTWHGADVVALRLPMRGAADSLNVSAAAAVLFYEALRQRSATIAGRPHRDLPVAAP
ncbi:MAG: RNA methyltransferase [Chloroflexi bacterium]|nr:RNA methyltransferase [Chloroflexota bacterium]